MPKTPTQSTKAPKGKKRAKRAASKRSKNAKTTGALLAAALKSFVGHLEGTGKSAHTIAAYRFDLRSFAEFLDGSRVGKTSLDLRTLMRRDLERYHDWLRNSGQKTNTRRRKLMTVRKFMHYLTHRKKLDLDIAKKLPAPEKLERVPETVDLAKFRDDLRKLDTGSPLARRNESILGVLMDTGCGVSEAAQLRWTQIDLKTGMLRFVGKSVRDVKLSVETLASLARLKEEASEDDLCFAGWNRHGPIRIGKRALGITPRGIELLVKGLAEALGYPKLTPRTLRHSAVIEWFRAGVAEPEIQRRLGLRTPYAFRIYAPIFAAIRSDRFEPG